MRHRTLERMMRRVRELPDRPSGRNPSSRRKLRHGRAGLAGAGRGGPGVTIDRPGPIPILLVEDNPDDVYLAERVFKHHGLANPLHVFATGEEALDYLADASTRPRRGRDIVLLDLGLPAMTGFDVLRAIRRDPERDRVEVIVVTSAKAFGDISSAYAAGADAVMFKPIDFGQLADCAAELGLGWQLVETSGERSEPAEGVVAPVSSGADGRRANGDPD